MLPIFQITGRAVWFVASDAFTLFRLCWLPLALLVTAQYAMAYGVAHVSAGKPLNAIMESDAFAAAIWTEILLQGLALSVIAVTVHRIILFDDRRPNQYFAFPFGQTELLYVLMGGLSFAAIVVPAVTVGLAFAAVATLTGDVPLAKGPPELIALATIVGLAAYILALWLTLRLMLWPPTVVASNRLAFGDAWRLSDGNVLALFALGLASSITFIAIGGVVAIAAVQAGAVEALDLSKTLIFEGTPEARLARVVENRVNAQIIAYDFAFQFFVATYTVAVLSYAYKALKGFDMDLPIDRQHQEDVELEPGIKPMGKL